VVFPPAPTKLIASFALMPKASVKNQQVSFFSDFLHHPFDDPNDAFEPILQVIYMNGVVFSIFHCPIIDIEF
jgi:hypothetical protein